MLKIWSYVRKHSNQFFLSCSFHVIILDKKNLRSKFFLYVIIWQVDKLFL